MVDIRKIYSAERQHDSRIYLNVVAQKAAAFFGSTDSAIYLLPSSMYFKIDNIKIGKLFGVQNAIVNNSIRDRK